MKLTLKNQIEITGLDDFEQELIESSCTHSNPKYFEAQKQGRYTGNIPREIKLFSRTPDGLIVPSGLFSELLLEEPDADIDDQRNINPVSIPFTGQLRPYQQRFIDDGLYYEGGVMVAATGAGKTVSAIALAARLGQRTLILVKSKDLGKQWLDAIKQFTGLDAGMIGGGKNTEGAQFTIGLVQSLVKRNLSELDYGLVIADECHNAPACQFMHVINGMNCRYKYGLSATPQRRDNLEFMIFAALGEICAEIGQDQLEGKVLPVSVQTIRHPFDDTVESWNDFINSLINDDSRNDLIIHLANLQSKPTIILCSQVRQCEILTTLALDAGLKPLLIHLGSYRTKYAQSVWRRLIQPLLLSAQRNYWVKA